MSATARASPSAEARPYDWSKRFSRVVLRRTPNQLKKICGPYMGRKDIIFLGGGLPTPAAFPFTKLTAEARGGTRAEVASQLLFTALQYNAGGFKPYREWVTAFTKKHVRPAFENWGVVASAGNTDALDKAFSLLINEGDIVVCAKHTYPAISIATALGAQLVGVDSDPRGIDPNSLAAALRALQEEGKLARVKAVYTVPVGSNPTGAVVTPERMRALYAVARKYDVAIIEDAPYDWLQFSEYDSKGGAVDPARLPGIRFRSMASLDEDGRVVRLDTLSKVLAPGLRAGWVTGAKAFVDKFQDASNLSSQSGSAVSHSIAHALLAQWGPEGLDKHVRSVQALYQKRRDIVARALDKHLRGLAEWAVPDSGMFFWVRVLGGDSKNPVNTRTMLPELIDMKVLVVPGDIFMAEPGTSPFFRISFSFASEDQLALGIEKLGAALQKRAEVNGKK